MAKNLQAKTRKIDNPYEVWKIGNDWEYRVLKKYQNPENEAKNPYARWFLGTASAFTYGEFELGDGYAHDVKGSATKVFDETVDGPFSEWEEK